MLSIHFLNEARSKDQAWYQPHLRDSAEICFSSMSDLKKCLKARGAGQGGLSRAQICLQETNPMTFLSLIFPQGLEPGFSPRCIAVAGEAFLAHAVWPLGE